MYVRIDRRRKLYATVLLRALGLSTQQLLDFYYEKENIHLEENGDVTRAIDFELLSEQRTLISALRCPILQVWRGVLAAVLVGELGVLAMSDLTQALLERVQATHARDVILDCTGVPTLGGHELGALTRLVAALRLLGARTTLVGLSPALAHGLAADGAGLPGARTLQSLADALQRVVGLRGG